MKAKLLLALAFLAGAIVAGCATTDPDHARAYVSSSVAFVQADQSAAPVTPATPEGPCKTCNNTGCVRTGGGEDILAKCPTCGRACNRFREAPVQMVGGRPVTFFVQPVTWSGQTRPEIMAPRVGDIWRCQDGVDRRWSGSGWQVKRCAGRNRCFWENER